jgi:hypothetical protein
MNERMVNGVRHHLLMMTIALLRCDVMLLLLVLLFPYETYDRFFTFLFT